MGERMAEKEDWDDERERDSQYRKELIETMKIKQGEAPAPEPPPKREPLEPKTFKAKAENFWYHHKYAVIIVAVLVVMGSILMASIFMQDTIDLTIMYATRKDIGIMTEESDKLKNALKLYAKDRDEDGKQVFIIDSVSIVREEEVVNRQVQQANQAKLMGTLTTDDIVLYIVDDSVYQYAQDGVSFAELDFLPQDDPHVKGKRYYLKDTAFAKAAGLTTLQDDVSLCIKKRSDLQQTNKHAKAQYDYAVEVFKNIVANKQITPSAGK